MNEQAEKRKQVLNSIITGLLDERGASVTRVDYCTIRVTVAAQQPGERDMEFTVTVKDGRP